MRWCRADLPQGARLAEGQCNRFDLAVIQASLLVRHADILEVLPDLLSPCVGATASSHAVSLRTGQQLAAQTLQCKHQLCRPKQMDWNGVKLSTVSDIHPEGPP